MKWYRIQFKDDYFFHVFSTLELISEQFDNAVSITSCGYNLASTNYHYELGYMLIIPRNLWKYGNLIKINCGRISHPNHSNNSK